MGESIPRRIERLEDAIGADDDALPVCAKCLKPFLVVISYRPKSLDWPDRCPCGEPVPDDVAVRSRQTVKTIGDGISYDDL